MLQIRWGTSSGRSTPCWPCGRLPTRPRAISGPHLVLSCRPVAYLLHTRPMQAVIPSPALKNPTNMIASFSCPLSGRRVGFTAVKRLRNYRISELVTRMHFCIAAICASAVDDWRRSFYFSCIANNASALCLYRIFYIIFQLTKAPKWYVQKRIRIKNSNKHAGFICCFLFLKYCRQY